MIFMIFNNINRVSVGPFGSLYAVGNVSLLDVTGVSVAGTRNIDAKSTKWLQSIISQCHCPIISGLALGADSVAHRTALDNNIPTIAVLPSGVNNIAPKSNIKLASNIVESGGLLLSAYHPDQGARKHQYIDRNKIIAYLGKMLIVPQCNKHSGTMHTVRFARNFNKYIIVNNQNYSGNQFILSDYPLAIPK